MKVLHLISGGDTGGAKTHIISLLKGMDKLIDTKIICFIEDTFYYEAKSLGIDIEVFKQTKRSDMSVVNRIADEIKKENYEIIHCHGARANFIAMFLRRKVKAAFLTTIHSDYELDFKDNFYKKIIFTNLNKFALKRFKHYIAISDSFKDMLVERGFKKEEIYTAYNGIDIEEEVEFLPKEEFLKRHNIDYKNEIIVGIAARLDKVKDHETFIRAASLVLEKRKDIIFLIAGDGYERNRLTALVEELGIQDKVHFLGYIKDPYSFFNAIDINALTSLSESFPYVILEGARLKKTIISTRVGGIKRLINEGENGFLVDVGDYHSIANKIEFLAKNRDKIKLMGEALYEKVRENHSSKSMARGHLEIYKIILGKDNVGNSMLISGYYGFDNSGDDAILKAIIKDIKSQRPDANITVLSKKPEKTREIYKVKAVNRFKIREIRREMKKSDIFLSGGGSLLQDITSTRSLIYYLLLMRIARFYRKPVMVYANGIGPIDRKLNRILTRNILNKVDLITLRDEDSYNFVKELEVKNKNIHITADPVFTLEASSREIIDEIFETEGIPRDKSYIGVSVRNWRMAENLVSIMAKVIEYIIEKYNVYVILIPMHYPEDLQISLEIKDRIEGGDLYVLEGQYSVEDLMGVIKELEIIIAMRLHSIIYAATQEIPMVGLSYDPKVDGILRSIGMDYICNVETLEFDELINNIDMVWKERQTLREKIRKQDEELKDKALSNVHMALDLLKSR